MPPKLSKEVCKTKLQKKIKKNISEMKTSKRYTTPQQAVAVAYSQLEDECNFPAPMKGKKSMKKGGMFGNVDFPFMGEMKPDTPAQAKKRMKDIEAAKAREEEQKALEADSYSYDEAREYDELLKQFSPQEQEEIMRLRSEAIKGGMCCLCEMKSARGKKKQ